MEQSRMPMCPVTQCVEAPGGSIPWLEGDPPRPSPPTRPAPAPAALRHAAGFVLRLCAEEAAAPREEPAVHEARRWAAAFAARCRALGLDPPDPPDP